MDWVKGWRGEGVWLRLWGVRWFGHSKAIVVVEFFSCAQANFRWPRPRKNGPLLSVWNIILTSKRNILSLLLTEPMSASMFLLALWQISERTHKELNFFPSVEAGFDTSSTLHFCLFVYHHINWSLTIYLCRYKYALFSMTTTKKKATISWEHRKVLNQSPRSESFRRPIRYVFVCYTRMLWYEANNWSCSWKLYWLILWNYAN